MSEVPVFLIGIVIFAITVYGAVMAGGMALTKVVVDEAPQRQPESEDAHTGP